MTDTHAATELKLYIDNDGDLYHRQTLSILKNLATKWARGEYKHDLAVKAFGYLVEAGAKKYAHAFGVDQPWHTMFDVGTRKLVAEELARHFEAEVALGNYDHLLPKKYQGKVSRARGVTAHARRKAMSVRGSSRGMPRTAREMQSHVSAQDIREFRGFLGNASDGQVQGIYEKEKRAGRDVYAELAAAEAVIRGLPLDEHYHARRKSPTQLDHEIATVLGKRRYHL
jgi:hypothetical protein